jgi:hypothetical protein
VFGGPQVELCTTGVEVASGVVLTATSMTLSDSFSRLVLGYNASVITANFTARPHSVITGQGTLNATNSSLLQVRLLRAVLCRMETNTLCARGSSFLEVPNDDDCSVCLYSQHITWAT